MRDSERVRLPDRVSFNWRQVKRNGRETSVCRAVAFFAALALGYYGLAFAAPTDGVVTGGAGQVTQEGPRTRVDQYTQRLDIDWRTFSTGVNESVDFAQPNRTAIAINRVVGGVPSELRGALTANGRIFILNKHGVTFHATSRVNVGALLATTATDVSGDGQVLRFQGGGQGAVVNHGNIRVSNGGFAILAAPHVTNTGIVQANLGQVGLLAADGLTVDLRGDGLITYTWDPAPGGSVTNTGYLAARSGRVHMAAADAADVVDGVVNADGIVDASQLGTKNDGGVVLVEGGSIAVAGVIDADGRVGGQIDILGDDIILKGADLSASGPEGGGHIRVGGDYQGKGSVRNADNVTVDAAAAIRADATVDGDGGRVIVWSDGTTTVHGEITARGGPAGGDGGFIETSGKKELIFTRSADASAPNGAPGTWLLDPENIDIGRGQADAIEGSLNLGNNVSIKTGSGGEGEGDIAVNASITKSQGDDAALSMDAHGKIDVNAPIKSTSGKLDVKMTAGKAVNVNNSIETNGGNVSTRVTGVVEQVEAPPASETEAEEEETLVGESAEAGVEVAGTGGSQSPASGGESSQSGEPATTEVTDFVELTGPPEIAASSADPVEASGEAVVTDIPAVVETTPAGLSSQGLASAEAAGDDTDESAIGDAVEPELRPAFNLGGSIVTGGGRIDIEAVEGVANLDGVLDASNPNEGEVGGVVTVFADEINVGGEAVVDVTGDAGGGTALIGGELQGKGESPTASRTTVDAGAQIRADAVTDGDGGTVIVWADGRTEFRGEISARGGAQGGDGGFVEVSGKEQLVFRGKVDGSAPNGRNGTLLLDPNDIRIRDGAGTGNVDEGPSTASQSVIFEQDLEAQSSVDVILMATQSITLEDLTDDVLLMANGADLTLQVTGSGTGAIAFSDYNDTIKVVNKDARLIIDGGSSNAVTVNVGHLVASTQQTGNSAGNDVSALVDVKAGGNVRTGNLTAIAVTSDYAGGAANADAQVHVRSGGDIEIDGSVRVRAESYGVPSVGDDPQTSMHSSNNLHAAQAEFTAFAGYHSDSVGTVTVRGSIDVDALASVSRNAVGTIVDSQLRLASADAAVHVDGIQGLRIDDDVNVNATAGIAAYRASGDAVARADLQLHAGEDNFPTDTHAGSSDAIVEVLGDINVVADALHEVEIEGSSGASASASLHVRAPGDIFLGTSASAAGTSGPVTVRVSAKAVSRDLSASDHLASGGGHALALAQLAIEAGTHSDGSLLIEGDIEVTADIGVESDLLWAVNSAAANLNAANNISVTNTASVAARISANEGFGVYLPNNTALLSLAAGTHGTSTNTGSIDIGALDVEATTDVDGLLFYGQNAATATLTAANDITIDSATGVNASVTGSGSVSGVYLANNTALLSLAAGTHGTSMNTGSIDIGALDVDATLDVDGLLFYGGNTATATLTAANDITIDSAASVTASVTGGGSGSVSGVYLANNTALLSLAAGTHGTSTNTGSIDIGALDVDATLDVDGLLFYGGNTATATLTAANDITINSTASVTASVTGGGSGSVSGVYLANNTALLSLAAGTHGTSTNTGSISIGGLDVGATTDVDGFLFYGGNAATATLTAATDITIDSVASVTASVTGGGSGSVSGVYLANNTALLSLAAGTHGTSTNTGSIHIGGLDVGATTDVDGFLFYGGNAATATLTAANDITIDSTASVTASVTGGGSGSVSGVYLANNTALLSLAAGTHGTSTNTGSIHIGGLDVGATADVDGFLFYGGNTATATLTAANDITIDSAASVTASVTGGGSGSVSGVYLANNTALLSLAAGTHGASTNTGSIHIGGLDVGATTDVDGFLFYGGNTATATLTAANDITIDSTASVTASVTGGGSGSVSGVYLANNTALLSLAAGTHGTSTNTGSIDIGAVNVGATTDVDGWLFYGGNTATATLTAATDITIDSAASVTASVTGGGSGSVSGVYLANNTALLSLAAGTHGTSTNTGSINIAGLDVGATTDVDGWLFYGGNTATATLTAATDITIDSVASVTASVTGGGSGSVSGVYLANNTALLSLAAGTHGTSTNTGSISIGMLDVGATTDVDGFLFYGGNTATATLTAANDITIDSAASVTASVTGGGSGSVSGVYLANNTALLSLAAGTHGTSTNTGSINVGGLDVGATTDVDGLLFYGQNAATATLTAANDITIDSTASVTASVTGGGSGSVSGVYLANNTALLSLAAGTHGTSTNTGSINVGGLDVGATTDVDGLLFYGQNAATATLTAANDITIDSTASVTASVTGGGSGSVSGVYLANNTALLSLAAGTHGTSTNTGSINVGGLDVGATTDVDGWLFYGGNTATATLTAATDIIIDSAASVTASVAGGGSGSVSGVYLANNTALLSLAAGTHGTSTNTGSISIGGLDVGATTDVDGWLFYGGNTATATLTAANDITIDSTASVTASVTGGGSGSVSGVYLANNTALLSLAAGTHGTSTNTGSIHIGGLDVGATTDVDGLLFYGQNAATATLTAANDITIDSTASVTASVTGGGSGSVSGVYLANNTALLSLAAGTHGTSTNTGSIHIGGLDVGATTDVDGFLFYGGNTATATLTAANDITIDSTASVTASVTGGGSGSVSGVYLANNTALLSLAAGTHGTSTNTGSINIGGLDVGATTDVDGFLFYGGNAATATLTAANDITIDSTASVTASVTGGGSGSVSGVYLANNTALLSLAAGTHGTSTNTGSINVGGLDVGATTDVDGWLFYGGNTATATLTAATDIIIDSAASVTASVAGGGSGSVSGVYLANNTALLSLAAGTHGTSTNTGSISIGGLDVGATTDVDGWLFYGGNTATATLTAANDITIDSTASVTASVTGGGSGSVSGVYLANNTALLSLAAGTHGTSTNTGSINVGGLDVGATTDVDGWLFYGGNTATATLTAATDITIDSTASVTASVTGGGSGSVSGVYLANNTALLSLAAGTHGTSTNTGSINVGGLDVGATTDVDGFLFYGGNTATATLTAANDITIDSAASVTASVTGGGSGSVSGVYLANNTALLSLAAGTHGTSTNTGSINVGGLDVGATTDVDGLLFYGQNAATATLTAANDITIDSTASVTASVTGGGSGSVSGVYLANNRALLSLAAGTHGTSTNTGSINVGGLDVGATTDVDDFLFYGGNTATATLTAANDITIDGAASVVADIAHDNSSAISVLSNNAFLGLYAGTHGSGSAQSGDVTINGNVSVLASMDFAAGLQSASAFLDVQAASSHGSGFNDDITIVGDILARARLRLLDGASPGASDTATLFAGIRLDAGDDIVIFGAIPQAVADIQILNSGGSVVGTETLASCGLNSTCPFPGGGTDSGSFAGRVFGVASMDLFAHGDIIYAPEPPELPVPPDAPRVADAARQSFDPGQLPPDLPLEPELELTLRDRVEQLIAEYASHPDYPILFPPGIAEGWSIDSETGKVSFAQGFGNYFRAAFDAGVCNFIECGPLVEAFPDLFQAQESDEEKESPPPDDLLTHEPEGRSPDNRS